MAHIIIPKEWPYESWLGLDFLIEDNLSVKAQLSLYNPKPANKNYVSMSSAEVAGGYAVRIWATYGF